MTSALLQYSRLVEVEAWGTAAVGPPPSSTTLASSLNPSTVGASVTFTATVTGTNPTGNVAFTDGGNAISGCSAVALTGSGNVRTAPCTSSALSQGTHSIVAAYAGDAGNAASSSSPLSQVVNAAGSSNVALASNGAVASASSTFSAAFPVSAVNNNERAGVNWGNGGGWNDATGNAFPDWVQINFNGSKTINRVVVYTLQDNYTAPVEPTDTPDLQPLRHHRLHRPGQARQPLDHAWPPSAATTWSSAPSPSPPSPPPRSASASPPPSPPSPASPRSKLGEIEMR